MKKIISVVLTAAMTASMFAAVPAQAEETFDIVVMPKLVSIPYFQTTGEGATAAGEDLGVNVIYNGPTTADAAQQVTMLEDYISQGVDAICVAPNDPAAMTNVLQKARDAGILVLDWDTPTDESLVDASVHQIDDVAFGQNMVDLLVEEMGTDEGEYAIITGGLSAQNLNNWIAAATEYAEEKYPNLTLVADPFPTDEKQDVAVSTTKEVLQAYPDLKGILGFSTPTAPGCGLGIRELGMQDSVALVANGVEADVQDVLSDGSLDVGTLWNCYDLGYLTVCVANALLQGKTLENGMEIDGWESPIELQGDKVVILGPAEEYRAE